MRHAAWPWVIATEPLYIACAYLCHRAMVQWHCRCSSSCNDGCCACVTGTWHSKCQTSPADIASNNSVIGLVRALTLPSQFPAGTAVTGAGHSVPRPMLMQQTPQKDSDLLLQTEESCWAWAIVTLMWKLASLYHNVMSDHHSSPRRHYNTMECTLAGLLHVRTGNGCCRDG